MGGGLGSAKTTQGPTYSGVQVTTCLYNTAIPILYGKRRAQGHVVWFGNFGPGPSNKKGKAGKKGITTYQANLDCLVAFGPLWGILNTYNNSTLIGYDYPDSGATFAHVETQTYDVTSGSFADNTYSGTVSVPGGNTLDGIYAISFAPTSALSVTINDYGDPLGSRTLTESNTEEWLYNIYGNFADSGAGSMAWRPGCWEFGDSFCNNDHCSYPIGTDWGGDAFTVYLNTPQAGTITVYYAYHENNHSTPLSYINYEFEPTLGSGNEYSGNETQQIIYPDVSGIGGVGIDLGASAAAPELDVEPIGLYSLTNTGQVNPADIILDLILSGNIYFGSAPEFAPICWSHGLNFAGDPTRQSFQDYNAAGAGTQIWPPTCAFQYTTPTVYGGPINTSAAFSILKDPPTFFQGAYETDTEYNVNTIISYEGTYYKAIIGTDATPLTDPFWSVYTGGFSDGLTDVRNYCAANSIFASLLLNSQRDASEVLNELCEIANCVAVWNGQSLDFYPYSEVSQVGGGYQFTPRTASGPLAAFDFRHFVVGKNESPLTVKQEGMQGVANILDINYADAGYSSAANPDSGMSGYPSYQSNNVRICDDEHCALYGPLLGSPRGYDDYICDAMTATTVGWPVIKRQRFADPYQIEFKLPASIASLLDPMDLITASDPVLFGGTLPNGILTTGPGSQDVRISTLSEDDRGEWSLSCERFMYGMSAPNSPSVTESIPNPPPATNTSAGNVNAPYFWEPTASLAQALGMQPSNGLCIGVSSNSTEYGGCQVWVSTDGGSSYNQVGSLPYNSTMGVLTNAYPENSNPDTSDTLSVNLSESLGDLVSFTTAQQNQLVSIALLSGGGTGSAAGYTTTIPYEVIAYGSVTMTATHEYNLTPTILRGQLGTVPASHDIGSITADVYVDLTNTNTVFKTTIPSNAILGQALYFKFPSFNLYGQAVQELSECTAYTFTPTGQTNPAGTVGPAGQYTISPNPCLYQGQSGGWPTSISPLANTWTNVDNVYFPAVTVNYNSGAVTYSANNTGVSAFTGSGQTAYVTIYDPAKAGGSQPAQAASTNVNATTPGYVYLGTITSASSGANGNAGGSSAPSGPTDPGTTVTITVNGTPWI